MPMQFGLFMMPLHPPERSFTESYDRDLAQIVAADRLGYHEVWIGEQLTERWEKAPAPELLTAQALVQTAGIIRATGGTRLASTKQRGGRGRGRPPARHAAAS